MRKVKCVEDNDGHWYVIPQEMYPEFSALLDMGEEGEEEFNEKFSQYMTGGDLNCTQLWAEI